MRFIDEMQNKVWFRGDFCDAKQGVFTQKNDDYEKNLISLFKIEDTKHSK